MRITKDTIILTDNQATARFGDDWQTVGDGGSIFFDGNEVFAKPVKDGVFDRLELTSVHGVDFEELYG